MLAEFELAVPKSLEEALDLMVESAEVGAGPNGGAAAPLAGGSNLLVDIRAHRSGPARLIALGAIPGLRRIQVEGNGRITIGAGTTLSDILRHPALATAAPSLVSSALVFAGHMVRNTATVVGNVCYGSPAADVIPPLLTLDAEVGLASKAGGRRVVPLDEFFHGFKRSVRRADELVTEIAWSAPPPNAVNSFYKLARRKGDAVTVVGVAITLAADAGRCRTARIALGAVSPVIHRARAAEDMLVGEALTPALIEDAAHRAMETCDPIDDLRASADYRRHCVHVLTRRLLNQARERFS